MKFKTLNEKVNIQKRIGWILSFKNGLGYKHGFDARIDEDKDGVFVEGRGFGKFVKRVNVLGSPC